VNVALPTGAGGLTRRVNLLAAERVALFANLNLLERIPKVNGFPSLQPREQDDIEALLYRSPGTEYPALMDFLGVSVVSTRSNILDWTSRTTALRLITAGQKPVFLETSNILPALASSEFRPRDEVYFPRELESKITVRNSSVVKVESKRVTAHRIEADTTASEPAMLVIAQTFYHQWQAMIDGHLGESRSMVEEERLGQDEQRVGLRPRDRGEDAIDLRRRA